MRVTHKKKRKWKEMDHPRCVRQCARKRPCGGGQDTPVGQGASLGLGRRRRRMAAEVVVVGESLSVKRGEVGGSEVGWRGGGRGVGRE